MHMATATKLSTPAIRAIMCPSESEPALGVLFGIMSDSLKILDEIVIVCEHMLMRITC